MVLSDVQTLTLVELSVGNYSSIRNTYKMAIKGAIMDYFLTENAAITKFRNAFYRAVTTAFGDAFETGYVEGGGDPEQFDPDDQEWINGAIEGEKGFVLMLFDEIKARKKEGLEIAENETWADARAEGYAKTLDKVYSQGIVRGNKNQIAEFGGDDGEESCSTCQRLKGQKHPLRWWINRGLVPFRGNRNYECGNWQCGHYLFNAKTGKVLTI